MGGSVWASTVDREDMGHPRNTIKWSLLQLLYKCQSDKLILLKYINNGPANKESSQNILSKFS